jgi:putative nucleotidyltransferase with HDIG domain
LKPFDSTRLREALSLGLDWHRASVGDEELHHALQSRLRNRRAAVAAALARAQNSVQQAADSLISMLQLHEKDGRGHSTRVTHLALALADELGVRDGEVDGLEYGAMLHDVGKIEMPLRVRHREETFTPDEQQDYEQHVTHGLVHAARMGLSAGATTVIAQHHEHADGSGFPNRLNTDRMSLGARIVSLVDRYDNLCNPYFLAKAMTPHEALSLLFAQGKTQYDTTILSGFIKMMGVYPPGSTVQLTDDRHAMVVGVSSTRSLKPSVLVHDPRVPREEALVLDLESAEGIGIRRSVRTAQLPRAAQEYLAPAQRVCYYFEPAGSTRRLAA